MIAKHLCSPSEARGYRFCPSEARTCVGGVVLGLSKLGGVRGDDTSSGLSVSEGKKLKYGRCG